MVEINAWDSSTSTCQLWSVLQGIMEAQELLDKVKSIDNNLHIFLLMWDPLVIGWQFLPQIPIQRVHCWNFWTLSRILIFWTTTLMFLLTYPRLVCCFLKGICLFYLYMHSGNFSLRFKVMFSNVSSTTVANIISLHLLACCYDWACTTLIIALSHAVFMLLIHEVW